MDNTSKLYDKFVASPLVPMTLRVAVAGHREHDNIAADNTQLVSQIAALYRQLYSALQDCRAHQYAQQLYADTPAILRIMSSLADGADRLLLEPELVGQSFELACVLPFHADEYANDFSTQSKQEYEHFLLQAGYQTEGSRVLELNGQRKNEEHAYRDCGEMLVKNCDLLVALYDGKERPGFGTAWTVKQALMAKIPVIWIDIEHPNHASFIQNVDGVDHVTELSDSLLRSWLGHVLLFDTILTSDKANNPTTLTTKILQKFERYQQEQAIKCAPQKEVDFNDSGPISMKHNVMNPLYHGFSFLKGLFTSKQSIKRKVAAFQLDKSQSTSLCDPVDHLCELFHNPSSHAFFAAYLRADRLASRYAMLHRSTFVFIYLLGALAMMIAALAIAVAGSPDYPNLAIICAVLELVILLAIFSLFKQDHTRTLHDKWLEYRCIAEFLRPTLYLSFFGSHYPMRRFRDNEETLGRNLLGHGGPERCWAYLYTETVLRWVGFSGLRISPEYLDTAITFSRGQWLSSQYQYHTHNAIGMKLLGKRLAKLSEVMYWSTIGAVSCKIALSIAPFLPYIINKLMGLLACWLPVLGTTAFAIRNHAEFELSAQRSLSAREFLLSYNKRLKALQAGDVNLLELDKILTELTTQSISETADWLEIYEIKESETA